MHNENMKFTYAKPFTNGDMKRIGIALKEGREPDPDKFAQVMDWYDQLISEIAAIAFEALQDYNDESPNLPLNLRLEEVPLPAMRIKSDDTIAEKLVRLGTKLDRIQDFVGCRFDLQCTPSAQRAIAQRLKAQFEELGVDVQIKDYLENSQYGYRAVHLHLTSPAGRSELQIRTLLQASWANLNEVIGDLYGRQHRYESIDKTHPGFDLISEVAMIADDIKVSEEKNDEGYHKVSELLGQTPQMADDPNVQRLLELRAHKINEANTRVIDSLDRVAASLRNRGALQ